MTPMSISMEGEGSPTGFLRYLSMAVLTSEPRKMDMMAGGASLAPSLKSLEALATQVLRRSPCMSTERTAAAIIRRKGMFSSGLSPGVNKQGIYQ